MTLADSFPSNGENPLSPDQRMRVVVRAGKALLDLGRPADARDRLLGVAGNGAPSEVLDLLESVAVAFLAEPDYAAARDVGYSAVERE